jgi:leader peptidase (prepilin peptidase)/N-methyltransferase
LPLALATAVLTIALVAAASTDIRSRRLPDYLTLPLIVLGVIQTQALNLGALLPHALAALLGFLAFYLIATLYRRVRGYDGLGLGDAKLLAAAGAWLGPLYLAPVVFVSAVLALVAALILRLLGRNVSLQMTLPFGPFLSAGFFGFWCLKISGWSPF